MIDMHFYIDNNSSFDRIPLRISTEEAHISTYCVVYPDNSKLKLIELLAVCFVQFKVFDNVSQCRQYISIGYACISISCSPFIPSQHL